MQKTKTLKKTRIFNNNFLKITEKKKTYNLLVMHGSKTNIMFKKIFNNNFLKITEKKNFIIYW